MKCAMERTDKMTFGDSIRNMTDEELAVMFFHIISEREHRIVEKLAEAGIDVTLIELPYDSIQAHLDLMRSPYEP